MGSDSGYNTSQGKRYVKSTFQKGKKSMHMIYSTDKIQQASLKGRRKCPDAILKGASKSFQRWFKQEHKKKKKKKSPSSTPNWPLAHQGNQCQMTREVWVVSLRTSSSYCGPIPFSDFYTKTRGLKSILVCSGGRGSDVRTGGISSLLLVPIKVGLQQPRCSVRKTGERSVGLFKLVHESLQAMYPRFCKQC